MDTVCCLKDLKGVITDLLGWRERERERERERLIIAINMNRVRQIAVNRQIDRSTDRIWFGLV